ncbi:hypothetical protein ZWY2020_004537 [Hordeum vulgare]|nr:hypothetical protein ZWY2020_004537 [Hordeum vulgare]
MPKGAKKRAKLKKKQQGGQPAGSNGGATTTNNNDGSNNSSHGDAASDGNHLPIKLTIPPVDASEDSMESSEEMVTPRAEVADEESKGAASEVPVERAVEVADEGATGEAGEEVMVDALPPEAADPEQEGKVDVTAEAHAVVQEPEVQDVVVSEAPEVLEPEVRSEEVVVRDTAKLLRRLQRSYGDRQWRLLLRGIGQNGGIAVGFWMSLLVQRDRCRYMNWKELGKQEGRRCKVVQS